MNAPQSGHQSTEETHLTDAAAWKIYQLISEEGNPNLCLRVFITGGGCSGFQYGFTFDEQPKPDDIYIHRPTAKALLEQPTLPQAASDERDGEADGSTDSGTGQTDTHIDIGLLIDPLSYQYLTGAQIDYQSDVKGEQFVIRNPNAQTTCGCGASFSA